MEAIVTSPQRIQRRRTKGWRMPDGAVYVGRPTKWGNPFQVRHNRSVPGEGAWFVDDGIGVEFFTTEREAAFYAMEAYRSWLDWPEQADLRHAAAQRLAGYDLACWCPLEDAEGNRVPCHADVLLGLANPEVSW